MAAHARLKNEFTEDKKCHNLIRWLKLSSVRLCCVILDAVFGVCVPVLFDVLGKMWNSVVSVPDFAFSSSLRLTITQPHFSISSSSKHPGRYRENHLAFIYSAAYGHAPKLTQIEWILGNKINKNNRLLTVPCLRELSDQAVLP